VIAGSNRTERMDVSFVVFIVLCRVGCDLCNRLIPRSGGSCGVCVCVCERERERFSKLDNEGPRPELGCRATGKTKLRIKYNSGGLVGLKTATDKRSLQTQTRTRPI